MGGLPEVHRRSSAQARGQRALPLASPPPAPVSWCCGLWLSAAISIISTVTEQKPEDQPLYPFVSSCITFKPLFSFFCLFSLCLRRPCPNPNVLLAGAGASFRLYLVTALCLCAMLSLSEILSRSPQARVSKPLWCLKISCENLSYLRGDRTRSKIHVGPGHRGKGPLSHNRCYRCLTTLCTENGHGEEDEESHGGLATLLFANS